MSSDLIKPVPPDVVGLVDQYVRKAIQDATSYDNSEPLDESGIYSLHLLAADIYGRGFSDGDRVACLRAHGEHMRELLRERLAAKQEPPVVPSDSSVGGSDA